MDYGFIVIDDNIKMSANLLLAKLPKGWIEISAFLC